MLTSHQAGMQMFWWVCNNILIKEWLAASPTNASRSFSCVLLANRRTFYLWFFLTCLAEAGRWNLSWAIPWRAFCAALITVARVLTRDEKREHHSSPHTSLFSFPTSCSSPWTICFQNYCLCHTGYRWNLGFILGLGVSISVFSAIWDTSLGCGCHHKSPHPRKIMLLKILV